MYIEAAPIERRLHHSTFGACSEPGRDMEGLRFFVLAIFRVIVYNMVELHIKTNMSKAFEITAALLLFAIGGCIYIAFRSTSLQMFVWFDNLGLHEVVMYVRNLSRGIQIPEFVRFCVPDGLWTLSYILFMDAIWLPDVKRQLLFSCIIPLIGSLSEVLQYFGVVKGTFDLVDLSCYIRKLPIYR